MKKHIPLIFTALVTIFLLFFLQGKEEFLFYYREHNQLFLNLWSDILPKLFSVGGFSLVITQFLVQFFGGKFVGAMITALLTGLSGWMLWGVVRKVRPSLWVLPLCFVPYVLNAVALTDQLWSWQSVVSLALATLAIFLCTSFKDRPLKVFVSVSVVVVIATFLLAGAAASVSAAGILAWAFAAKTDKWWLQVIPGLVLLCLGGFFISQGWTVDFARTFFVHGYYEPMLGARALFWIAWATIPVVILLARIPSPVKGILNWGTFAASSVLLLVITLFSMSSFRHEKQYDLIRLIHFAFTEDWDEILADRTVNDENLLYMNLRNLALSRRGELLERLFEFPQKSPLALVAATENSNRNPELAILIATVQQQMGNCSAAQNPAFDASIGSHWGNPYALKLLVNTNLAQGNYEAADKYITTLEHTLGYSSWAKRMRRYLYNDAAVEADPLLARLKNGQSRREGFIGDPTEGLARIVEANPSDNAAREYYIASLLLSKDLQSLLEYIDRNYPAGSGEMMPELLQQAYITCCTTGLATMDPSRIEASVQERYSSFVNKLRTLSKSNSNPQLPMHKSFGDTFWYYLIFADV